MNEIYREAFVTLYQQGGIAVIDAVQRVYFVKKPATEGNYL